MLLSSVVFIFVLVSSTIIQNVFTIFVIVFVVVDEKNTGLNVLPGTVCDPTHSSDSFQHDLNFSFLVY